MAREIELKVYEAVGIGAGLAARRDRDAAAGCGGGRRPGGAAGPDAAEEQAA